MDDDLYTSQPEELWNWLLISSACVSHHVLRQFVTIEYVCIIDFDTIRYRSLCLSFHSFLFSSDSNRWPITSHVQREIKLFFSCLCRSIALSPLFKLVSLHNSTSTDECRHRRLSTFIPFICWFWIRSALADTHETSLERTSIFFALQIDCLMNFRCDLQIQWFESPTTLSCEFASH